MIMTGTDCYGEYKQQRAICSSVAPKPVTSFPLHTGQVFQGRPTVKVMRYSGYACASW